MMCYLLCYFYKVFLFQIFNSSFWQCVKILLFRNDIEQLVISSETEMIKLNEVIADLNKQFEEVSIKHGEYVRQAHDLEQLMEQSMKQVKGLNGEVRLIIIMV